MKCMLLHALALAAAASLLGCNRAPATGQPETASALEIQTGLVRSTAVPNQLDLVGSLNAQERVTISSEVPGIVSEIRLDFGDRVRVGEILVRLDAHENRLRAEAARAALAQSRAVLARARADHDRAVELHQKKVLSDEMFDRAVSELHVAEANSDAAVTQLAIAEKHVEDTTIRSPLDGFIATRHVSVGQYVAPPAPVLDLVAVDPLKLRVDVPDHDVGLIRDGMAVRVETDAFPGEWFHGTIRRIGSALDPSTRTLPVEGSIPNPDARLKPGQFARAIIDLGVVASVVAPRAAVDTFAGVDRAFVVRQDRTIEARTVTLGRDLGEEIVVTGGLQPGEEVAVSHIERLADGMQVRVAERPST